MNNTSGAIPAVIGNILIAVFAVLCLTVLAVLALSTWRNDTALSAATADSVQAYYAADCAAEEILAAIRAGALPEGVTKQGDRYAYVCPIDETRELSVLVAVEGSDFQVLRWQAKASGAFIIDDSLPVWGG